MDKPSDGSDADDSIELSRKAKQKRFWPSNHLRKHFDDVDETCDESDDFDNDNDDSTDEAWIASDQERKRNHRPSSMSRHCIGSSSKSSLQSVSNQRSKITTGISRASSRSSRGGLQSTKASNRSKSTAQMSPVSSRRRFNKDNVSTKRSPSKLVVQLPFELTKPRQCFGPGCTRAAARPDTKYCSDECGLRMAYERINILLPECLDSSTDHPAPMSSATPKYFANQIDQSRLDEIQCEKRTLHDRLVQLELEHQRLSAFISQVRSKRFDKQNEAMLAAVANDSEEVDQMEPVVCVTCATEVSMRHALRHMERCFQKMEGNTVFCANQKEKIMGTPLFCDHYDLQAKAYCKRLRVVCEHFKESKLPPDAICGFPLVRNVFEETGELCCVPHSKCTRHVGWERLRRASIDLERYRHLIRMDELMQEEQRISQTMSQRGGILGLLLHRTIDHNPSIAVSLPDGLRVKFEKTNPSNNSDDDT